MKRFAALALLGALAACSGGATNPCDPAGIGRAIDDEAGGADPAAKKADRLDDLAAGIVQCEASSATARTDPKDPLNLQLARANLAAGRAYAAAGNAGEARRHLDYATFTARFVGDDDLAKQIAAARAALR